MIGPTASQHERNSPLNIYRDSPFQSGFSDARFPIEAKLLRMTCLQNSLMLPFGFCIRSRNTRRIRGLSPYRYRRIWRHQREIQSYLGESLPLVLLQKGG